MTLATTREGLRQLGPRPSRSALRMRLAALRKLRSSIARFAPWPMLEASLTLDILTLEALLDPPPINLPESSCPLSDQTSR
jgi:hypothetical protein